MIRAVAHSIKESVLVPALPSSAISRGRLLFILPWSLIQAFAWNVQRVFYHLRMGDHAYYHSVGTELFLENLGNILNARIEIILEMQEFVYQMVWIRSWLCKMYWKRSLISSITIIIAGNNWKKVMEIIITYESLTIANYLSIAMTD